MRKYLIFFLLCTHVFVACSKSPSFKERIKNIGAASRQGRTLNGNIKNLIMGLDVVGCGYDVTSMRSRFCLLDLNRANDVSNWTDPLNTSVEFFVPYGFDVRDAAEAMHMLDTRVIHTVQEYFQQSIYTTTEKKRGFLGFGAKRITTEIGSLYHRLYEQNYVLALTVQQIIWYVLSVITFPQPKFNSITVSAFAALPETFDSTDATNIKKFEQFFDSFGTHIVTSAAMGGLVWAQDWLETCLLQQRNISWIRKQVRKRYDPVGIFSSSSSSDDTTTIINKVFIEHSSYSLQLLGGTESIPASAWQEWIPTVKYNPRPVSYELKPIYTLLTVGSAQRGALEAASLYYRELANEEASLYVQHLQALPKPPPSRCEPPANRRRRSVFDLSAEARALLCPYVGSEGLTCATESRASASSQLDVNPYSPQQIDPDGLIRLPRGVGTAFDLATGRLTFPAFNWTFEGGTRWQEHLSSRIFLIPNEIKLQPVYKNIVVDVQDAAIYRLYDKSLKERVINGGFFSRQPNATEYYEKYHMLGKKLNISQSPRFILYELAAVSPQLNSVANAAIGHLTVQYDEALYSSFLDVWGTHIATNTLIGGMVETQTSYQWLVSSFISPSACIDKENANKNRRRREVPQDISITKRRLGGDVTIDDNDQWEPTIGQNPALLVIKDFVPWSDFTSNPNIKENLNRAITSRVEASRLAQASKWLAIECRSTTSGNYTGTGQQVGGNTRGVAMGDTPGARALPLRKKILERIAKLKKYSQSQRYFLLAGIPP